MNPFRCQPQTSQGSRLLFHSIFALCCQHLDRLTGSWSTEAVKHRSKAAQLLEYALQNEESRNKFDLLEPILIMFTLDVSFLVLIKYVPWNSDDVVHTFCGWKLVDASNPRTLDPESLRRSQRPQQSAREVSSRHVSLVCFFPFPFSSMLFRVSLTRIHRWDTTLALISRQGPIMSQTYLDFLVRWEKEDEWSFFDLTGCPRDLVVHLYVLADLAKQNEIASSMKWLSFDMTPVIEAEREIVAWRNDSAPRTDADDDYEEESISNEQAESQFHDQQDRYHCAEAWRYASLLFIERVFKCSGNQRRRPRPIGRLVRLTLDHVRCGRRTSQIQKQLLLPVFLAGSEAGDENMRELAKEYCRYWAEKTRYEMFSSVPILLEEIWGVEGWWGSVIDIKTRPATPGQMVGSQFLFG